MGKEITRATEEDRKRREAREQKQRLLEKQAEPRESESDSLRVLAHLNSILETEEERVDLMGKEEEDNISDDAQLIYREILEVVQANEASSLLCQRGRMVGYGPELAECCLSPSGEDVRGKHLTR